MIETERRKVDAAKARRSVGQGVNGADIQAVTDELNAVLTNGAFKHQCAHMIIVQALVAHRRQGRRRAIVSRQSYAIGANCTTALLRTSSTACAKNRAWRSTVWRRANNARSERPHRRRRRGVVCAGVHVYVCAGNERPLIRNSVRSTHRRRRPNRKRRVKSPISNHVCAHIFSNGNLCR